MDKSASENQRPPRVFISYSHDSEAHCDRVLALAQQLRSDGIHAELDQFHHHEIVHWPRWCEEQIRPEKCDFVLCVCSEEYKRRVEGRVPADVGKGVFWEGTLIYNEVYRQKGNSRFIPILFEDGHDGHIPHVLEGWTFFQLDGLGLNELESPYGQLYRIVTKQGGIVKADIGAVQRLSPLDVPARATDFMALIHQDVATIRDGVSELNRTAKSIFETLKNREAPPSTRQRPHNLPPWMPPERFIGREAELKTIYEALSAPEGGAVAVAQPQVVHAAGGVGKSQLARQAAWALFLDGRVEQAFFLSASSPDELQLSLAGLDAPSMLDIWQGAEPPHELDTRVAAVVEHLRKTRGAWLLVLDAADSADAERAVLGLVAKLTGGRILITSRREAWPDDYVKRIPLGLFTPEEARAYLRDRYWEADTDESTLEAFDAIAKELGYLPRALLFAASYMERRKVTPARYLDDWKKKRDSLLQYESADTHAEPTLLAAYSLSHELLSESSQTLMAILAWLAPELFPRGIVENSAILQEFLEKKDSAADVSGCLAELSDNALIELTQDDIRLHQITLACAQGAIPGTERAEALEFAISVLADALPDPDYDTEGWKTWARLGVHLDAAAESAKVLPHSNPALSTLCTAYGHWLFNQARYELSEPMMRQAAALNEAIYGPEHPNVAIRLNNLASLLQATNRLAEAEPLMRRGLAIDETSYGPDHPNVAIRLNNLASLLQATNRLAEAEPLMRRALAIDEASYGPDHPDVARDLSNLAQLLQDTNRLAEAEPLMRCALAIDEASYGPDHPNVATGLNNLAQLLKATNRLGEAEPLLRRALAIGEASYGPDHPNVATVLNNLAQLLQASDRHTEAEPLMRRALAIYESSYGPDHPNVATGLNNLASLLLGWNRLDEAEPLLRRALAIVEASYGHDHPQVAIELNNLAQVLQFTNRLDEAEPLMRRHMVIFLRFTRETGFEHPQLVAAFGNLGGLMRKMGLNDSAIGARFLELGNEAGFEREAFIALLQEIGVISTEDDGAIED